MEEEGPPLPLPAEQQRGGAGGGGPNGPGGAERGGEAPGQQGEQLAGARTMTPLPKAEACRLMDAHMRYAGVDLEGRRCSTVNPEGESIRLMSYVVKHPERPRAEIGYNACFWPREDADGWEIGYVVESSVEPCRNRDDYCRTGAVDANVPLSFRACPGDRDNLILDEAPLWERLRGRWELQAEGRKAELLILSSRNLRLIEEGARVMEGRIRLLSTTRMEVSGEHLWELYFALTADALYIGPAVIAPAKDPESFVASYGTKTRVRRLRGACYRLAEPAADAPEPVPCDLAGEGDAQTLTISLEDGERTSVLHRVGDFWMEAGSMGRRFVRVKGDEG